MATKSLTFDIFGRDKTASKAIRGVGDEADRTSGRFKSFGIAGGIALAAVAGSAVRFGTDAVAAASGAATVWRKTEKLFGDNAKEIENWSKTAASRFGISGRAAMGAAADFGNMYLQLGIAADSATDMSTKTVELAADLAAFNGLDTASVVDMISSAFRGEYDSLQRLVPNINAARVEQEAMAATGKTNASELTAQEKAMATLAIITGDGAVAIGAAGDAADTAAGKAATLNAKWEDMQAAVGAKLLDPLADVMGELSDSGAVEATASALGGVASALGMIFDQLEMKGGGKGPLLPGAEDLFHKPTETREGPERLIGQATDVVNALMNIGNPGGLDAIENWFIGKDRGGGGLVGPLVEWEQERRASFVEMWAGIHDDAVEGSENTRQGMGGGFSAAAIDNQVFRDAQTSGFAGMWGAIDGGTAVGLGGVNATTGAGLGVVGLTLGGLSPVASGAFGAAWAIAQAATGSGWAGVHGSTSSGMSTAGGILAGFQGIVSGKFAGIGSWLIGSGQALVSGFISGIRGMIGSVGSAVGDVLSFAKGFFPNSPAKRGPFSGAGWRQIESSGYAIGDTFAAGLYDSTSRIRIGADIASGILDAPRIAVGAAGGPAGFARAATETAQIVVPVSIDGREIARAQYEWNRSLA